MPEFACADSPAVPIRLLRHDEVVGKGAEFGGSWAQACGFKGRPGQILLVPDGTGAVAEVLVGWSWDDTARHGFADIMRRLPKGDYRLEGALTPEQLEEASLASLLAQYHFDRYSTREACAARLAAPAECDAERQLAIAAGEFLTRDLINCPANDMGPEQLEAASNDLAAAYSASIQTLRGEDLDRGFPLIAAVGRAAPMPPRLVDIRWGDAGPQLTLVGKGICFDSGGLNIKPGQSMSIMKKDMGGAAVALGLADMIMRLRLPLRLRVLIPIAENAISGGAMRPGDIVRARSGATVEITNTDAEGRLVLADALALAGEDDPDLTVSLATLTGAARVALGSEIAPFYSDSDQLAAILAESAEQARDPLWRMPLWQGYEQMLKSDIADMVNAPASGFAGSVTAALFLRRFVRDSRKWAHFDLYCWQADRGKGGIGQASHALLNSIPKVFGW
ncbi:MAG: leucyl aminopeptidase family protein [Rhodobacteraceae bacterium]|nr:leucyl aminopeptidase family protein [Paracoccaceae bacterium]